MALGSVNMVSFAPAEIGALLGNTSVIPFTRAEIDALVNRKAYPEGKLVYTGNIASSYNYSGSVTLPDDVDYIKLRHLHSLKGPQASWPSDGVRIARNTSVQLPYVGERSYDRYPTCKFSIDGVLTYPGFGYNLDELTCAIEGYHYC